MTQEEKEKVMLADDLSAYINEKHSQEECVGFIDGYNSALSKLKKLRVADVIKNEVAVCDCKKYGIEPARMCSSEKCINKLDVC